MIQRGEVRATQRLPNLTHRLLSIWQTGEGGTGGVEVMTDLFPWVSTHKDGGDFNVPMVFGSGF